MGSAPSTPTADGRPSLSRINTNTSMLRLTSRTAGVTSRRVGGRGRAELPPNGTPTDPADWPFIESCLLRLALFSGPAGPRVAAAAARATWVLSLDPGEILARAGDAARCDATAELYVVADGALELLAPRGGDSLARVALKRRGEADGEGALVGGVPRRATLAAATRARVWVLSRPAFRAAAAGARGGGGAGDSSAAARSSADGGGGGAPPGAALFLSDGVPLLAPLDAPARARVAAAARAGRHPPGAVVVGSGDAATGLVIVWEGEAALVPPAGGATTRLFPGDAVGAAALLAGAPHPASVLATTHVTTLVVDAGVFQECVAPALRATAGVPPSPRSTGAPPPPAVADIRVKRRGPDGAWTVVKCVGRGDDVRALTTTATGGGDSTAPSPPTPPTLTLVDGPPLGAGAFSRVTLATDPATGRRFALKRMRKTAVAPCPEHVWSERAVARGAVHPFCVRTYAAFHSRDHLYLLSDALPGGDLMDVLAADARVVRSVAPGPAGALAAALAPRCLSPARAPPRVLRGLAEPVARFYGGGVVLALAYLHGRGVVYRDLKPENVLIGADGYGRLADFGFAKALGPSGRTHTFCGTPGYVAPENVLAAGYGTTADWWGLGVLLYVLLTGRQPFSSPRTDDPMVVMRRIVDAGWRVPFPPYVSRDARALVAALLTRDPGRRLGGGPGGAADVMAHPWFRPLDWDALAARRLPCPRAPRGDAAKRLADLAARAEREKEKEKEREGRSRKGGEGEGDGGSEVDVEALFADF